MQIPSLAEVVCFCGGSATIKYQARLMLTEKCNPPSALAVLITIISNKETIFVLRKKGSMPKKGMKEEEMEKGDCGLPTPMKYKTLKNILEARDFPKTHYKPSNPTTARTQRFYALPKTPKAD